MREGGAVGWIPFLLRECVYNTRQTAVKNRREGGGESWGKIEWYDETKCCTQQNLNPSAVKGVQNCFVDGCEFLSRLGLTVGAHRMNTRQLLFGVVVSTVLFYSMDSRSVF